MYSNYKLKEKFLLFFPSYRWKGWLFSFIFGILIVSSYYVIHYLIPETSNYYYEVVTILFILVSVFILFPVRERLLQKILGRNDYEIVSGGDFHHLDFIARPFTRTILYKEVFPQMMEWLRVKNGRLVLIERDRKYYTTFNYNEGEVSRIKANYHLLLEELTKYAIHHRGLLRRTDPFVTKEMGGIMDTFLISAVQPIVFRRSLLGFLILNQMPLHKYADRALEIFAPKAAVTLRNWILSNRMIDARLYEQEFEAAKRIRRFLNSTKTPIISGYEIRKFSVEHRLAIIEFFLSKEGRWFLVILASSRMSGAAGILLSGVLGHLFSLIHRESELSLHDILGYLRSDEGLLHSEYPIDILVMDVDWEAGTFVTLADGNEFVFEISGHPVCEKITPAIRNLIELLVKESITIRYKSDALIEIARGGDE